MNQDEKKQVLKEIKKDIKSGKHKEAFIGLNKISVPTDDFVMQIKYANLFKSIPKDALDLKKIHIALLSSSTVDHFCDVLRYWLAKIGITADILEAPYNTIHQTILDPNSSLYSFNPEITMIFTNYRDIKFDVPHGSSFDIVHEAVTSAVNDFTLLWRTLWRRTNSYVIQNNADLPYHRAFGNYEGTALWGYLNMLRSFNLELAKAIMPGSTIFDLDYISSVYGRKKWHDVRYWYHSKHAFALDATGLVAYEASKVIGSIKGLSKKCIILDLDNTLWGGIIADDGMDNIKLGNDADGEAFVDFQKFLLKLKERGIILAVCSKNEEDIAKEPFVKHPHMQIKLDDVVIFKANWNDKVSNIKGIASILNIGLDSIVFIDDNPAERKLVREFLPMVSIPEMPQDPAEYVLTLSSQSYFEAISFSEEDKVRNEYYRDNVSRSEFQKHFTDLSKYLQSLQMEMTEGEFDDFNLPRVVQLINKSNQFHLTTTRYTESEIKAMRIDENKICRHFKLTDCFGDNGLISVIILEKQEAGELFIDTWVMSCRVLSRGAEEFICKEMISLARGIGCKKLIGKYIPTKKNRLVSPLYKRLCFKMIKEEDGVTLWELELNNNVPEYQTFIKGRRES